MKSKSVKKKKAQPENDSVAARNKSLEIQVDELRERFLFLIETWAPEKYRYEWLENHTNISSGRWQHVFHERQLPTLEMLMAMRDALPEKFYWLMFGTTPALIDSKLQQDFLSPSEESFNAFKAHREWIKQKRESKAEKKSAKEGGTKIKQTVHATHATNLHNAGRDSYDKSKR